MGGEGDRSRRRSNDRHRSRSREMCKSGDRDRHDRSRERRKESETDRRKDHADHRNREKNRDHSRERNRNHSRDRGRSYVRSTRESNSHKEFNGGGLGGGLGGGSGPLPRSRYKPQEEEFLDARREERERIGQLGVSAVWGKSPLRPDSEEETADSNGSKRGKQKKKRKKSKDSKEDTKQKLKKLKKKLKRVKKARKKAKKKSKSPSDDSSSSGEEEIWVEKGTERGAAEAAGEAGEADEAGEGGAYGPAPRVGPALGPRDFGRALLPGEGAAMAAFVAEGKRIPRRGEIGLTSDEIASYEAVGYVMSGSRHRRMEAVRIRKENQIYSADEKRALAAFSKEERAKRENAILAQFRDVLQARTQRHHSA
ncbi:unnamed protein product [Diatraea saccharalis]|uniref:NF-kappa-B-activating protein C-terminal domain-containing protein n=1 Tax=Diatraea saccharalis TaxID=40085 RepID=A0A9N9RD87_9NEOP|nr:unnamed protein product [Diatraea saccharalis]